MKKVLAILSLTTIIAFSSKAQKVTKPEGPISIGFEFGLPSGDLNTYNKAGFGLSAKYAYPVIKDGAVTGSVGYMSFSGKSVTVSSGGASYTENMSTWNAVPVKVGFRYHIAKTSFNIEPQLGYTFGNNSDASGFTWAIGAGYFFTKNIDLGVRYESVSVTSGNSNFVGFRLAYNFSLGSK